MLTGRKLLLADDSLTIQKVVSLTFGDEGCEVVTVGSGAEALTRLAEDVPDIVLADVHMPEPDGYQVCARIKQDERWRHIPVLLLVGTFEPFNEAEARRVGADDVLTKPFQSIRELMSKVGNLLGGHADEKPADEPQAHDEATDTARAAVVAEPHARAAAAAESNDATGPAFPWARPQATPPAARSTEPSAPQARSFNDFDMDDQTIQTTRAEELDAPRATTNEPAAPYVMQEVEAASDFAAHRAPEETFASEPLASEPYASERFTSEPFASSPAPIEASVAESTAEESFVVLDEALPHEVVEAEPESAPAFSYATAPQPASEFVARAAQSAAADDALLDLGDAGSPMTAADDDDEFILDLDDDDSFTQSAPRVLYAEGLATSTAEAAAPLVTADAPHTDARALEADAQAYAQPPQMGQAVDMVLPDADEYPAEQPATTEAMPVATDAAAPADHAYSYEPADVVADYEPAHVEPAAPVSEWQETAPQFAPAEAHDFAPTATEQSAATEQVPVEAEQMSVSAPAAHAGVGAQVGAVELSQATIDAIARRVVELMSDGVVREIAWEVVPELAERLIKRRMQDERTQAQ